MIGQEQADGSLQCSCAAVAAAANLLIADFLTDLAHANRSVHTRRAYAADLDSFVRFHRRPALSITPEILRGLFATIAHLRVTTSFWESLARNGIG